VTFLHTVIVTEGLNIVGLKQSIIFFFQVRVVSPDKDFFQILSPSLRLLRIATRGSQLVPKTYFFFYFLIVV
jgi:hypothetical protein